MDTELPLLVQWWNYFWAYERFPLFTEVLMILIPVAILTWWWQRSPREKT